MRSRAIFLVGMFFLSLSSLGQTPPKIPNELRDFYEKLDHRFKDLEDGLTNSILESSMDSKFLKAIFNHFKKNELGKTNQDFTILDSAPELKSKLLSLVKNKEKTATQNLTIEQLEQILNESIHKLSQEERVELASLILVQLEKQATGEKETARAIESLIHKYQKDPLLEETKNSDKKGLALLTDIITKGLSNPESLDTLFSPIKENIFTFEKAELPKSLQQQVPSFSEIATKLKELSLPSQSPFISNGLALNPFEGESLGSGNVPRRNSSSPVGRGINLGGPFSTPEAKETPQLKACTDEIRKKRFNVEIHLPGALCASTPIAKDPEKTLKQFRANPTGVCQVNLASALHCVEGIGNIQGRNIIAKMGNFSTQAKVLGVGSPDQITGRSLENGNPDLINITVEVPCESALRLQVARIPSPQEIAELSRKESLPIVMQQNSTINAYQDGFNGATIGAIGKFDQDENGRLSNFIRFNANFDQGSKVNNRSTLASNSRGASFIFDSDKIKNGDSGGSALTCVMDDSQKVKEILYMGAISYVDLTGDNNEGKTGGIASGQSLLNLSQRVWGNPQNASGNRFADNDRREFRRTSAEVTAKTH